MVIARLASAGEAVPLSTITFTVELEEYECDVLLGLVFTELHLYPFALLWQLPELGGGKDPPAVCTVATLVDVLVQFHQKL